MLQDFIHYLRSKCECKTILSASIVYTTKLVLRANPLNRLPDSLVVECCLRVREVPGSIPSQGPRHTKDIIKMVQVVPLFSTQH